MRLLFRLLLAAALLAFAGPAVADLPPDPPASPDSPARDSDQDGLSDATERATGTDPLKADTDSDGVADGREDRNRDGNVGLGESDPRVPGLFPGTYPHLPEPMVFDLVRGLGARSGELEVNTLVLAGARRGRLHVDWAPEVEYAFAPNHAIEVELPMRDRELMALKIALQGTFPEVTRKLKHGWQIIAEAPLDEPEADLSLLYLVGGRLGRSWSLFAMSGVRARASEHGLEDLEALLNPSVFLDAREHVTVGVETNIAVPLSGEAATFRLVPQLHWQIGTHVRLQLGAGLELSGDSVGSIWGTRIILE